MGKLKLLCQRLFKVPAARQALFLKAGGEKPMPDNIGQDDSKDLMFFSVEVRSLSFLVTKISTAKPIVWLSQALSRQLYAQPNRLLLSFTTKHVIVSLLQLDK